MVRQAGVEKLPEIITDLLVKHKPALLFIDSFKSLNEPVQTTVERRTRTLRWISGKSGADGTNYAKPRLERNGVTRKW